VRSPVRSPPRRRRDERGSALVEVVWLTVLLLVPLVYVLVAAFGVQRAAYGVSGAARAAARAYSLAPDEGSAAARARAAAAVALRDQRVPPDAVALAVSCRPVPGNCLSPGSSISVDVSYQVPLPLVPRALGGGRPSVRVEASHTVAYGTFREDR
jgi:Flp pilus assembly protein TadG